VEHSLCAEIFSNVTDTKIHSNTGIRDPYADEVNENWPFLKNNFDKAQYELIVEKKIIGNNLIGCEHFKQYVSSIVDIHAHKRDVLSMSTPDLIPCMIRKNKDVKRLIKSVKSRKVRVLRETFAERLDAGALPFEVMLKLPQIEG
jgi:hypothetical protein